MEVSSGDAGGDWDVAIWRLASLEKNRIQKAANRDGTGVDGSVEIDFAAARVRQKLASIISEWET